MKMKNSAGLTIHTLRFRSRLSRYAQRPTSKSNARKCAHARVAAVGVLKTWAMPAALGWARLANTGPSGGAMGTRYRIAGGAAPHGETMRRFVQRQWGRKNVKNQ